MVQCTDVSMQDSRIVAGVNHAEREGLSMVRRGDVSMQTVRSASTSVGTMCHRAWSENQRIHGAKTLSSEKVLSLRVYEGLLYGKSHTDSKQVGSWVPRR
jgi:hypothetical protein